MTRRILPLLAATTALATLAACGSSSSQPKVTSSAPTDKVLHLSFLQDPGQPPDPDIYYGGQGLILTQNLYEGLLSYKLGADKPEIAPALATDYQVSPDKATYTLTLRPGGDVPRRDAVHLGRRQGLVRPSPRREPGAGLHGYGHHLGADAEPDEGGHQAQGAELGVSRLPGLPVWAQDAEPDGARGARQRRPRAEVAADPRHRHRPLHADQGQHRVGIPDAGLPEVVG